MEQHYEMLMYTIIEYKICSYIYDLHIELCMLSSSSSLVTAITEEFFPGTDTI